MESKKYPRTPHLFFSPGATKDDRILPTVESFLNVPVVLLEKMDGSNLCMTRESVYARSHLGAPTHESFDFAKQLHAQVRRSIPDGLSIFGEYLFAVHSIRYTDLPGYFLIFGVREDATGKWWSWDEVERMAYSMYMPTVPVIGGCPLIFKSEEEVVRRINALMDLVNNYSEHPEGFVIRVAAEFTDFPNSVAKYVRANHVTTDSHWTEKTVERNGLKIL